MSEPFKLIRSKRRTIALSIVSDASLVVRAPMQTPLSYIERLVREKSNWIRKAIARVSSRPRSVFHGLSVGERKVLISRYKREARQKIPARVEWFALRAGVTYRSVKITSANKRWGSCSTKGDLNFSWRLVMAPPLVIDYVIAHELAHLTHKNHSKAFWNRVKALYPEHAEAEAWLKANEGRLNLG